jgi:hypothetical protein
MEGSLQGFLSPKGWKYGPIRLVALGQNDSFFMVTRYGMVVYQGIPKAMETFWADAQSQHGQTGNDIIGIYLSLFDASYVMLLKNGTTSYAIPSLTKQEDQSAFFSYIEAHLSAEKREQLKIKRRADEADVLAAKLSKMELENRKRDMYWNWKVACEKHFVGKGLRTFPNPPIGICTCVQPGCVARKASDDTGLKVCKHDVEALLRASGCYSGEWLRKERIPFHPDKYGMRCDPDVKSILVKKSTEMYSIFQELLDEENVKVNGNDG